MYLLYQQLICTLPSSAGLLESQTRKNKMMGEVLLHAEESIEEISLDCTRSDYHLCYENYFVAVFRVFCLLKVMTFRYVFRLISNEFSTDVCIF